MAQSSRRYCQTAFWPIGVRDVVRTKIGKGIIGPRRCNTVELGVGELRSGFICRCSDVILHVTDGEAVALAHRKGDGGGQRRIVRPIGLSLFGFRAQRRVGIHVSGEALDFGSAHQKILPGNPTRWHRG
jgi:hypothetical protein